MAKMLPAWVDITHTRSSAEVRLFELLRDTPGTEGWTVIHSLGLVRTETRPYGEIDFVVVIPETAIVCLEVKGGGVACDENGIWTTTDRFGRVNRLPRSPFDQARDAMFFLRKALLEKVPECERAGPLGFAVVVPDVSLDVPCVTWDRETLLDLRDFPPAAGSILTGVMRVAAATRRRHPGMKSLDAAGVRAVVGFLRPSFQRAIAISTVVGRVERMIGTFTEEQFVTLDTFADHERCLFDGAAGTGKTMLALELARRSAMAGRRTLFVCYNRLLGSWLNARARSELAGLPVTAGSLHRILRPIIGSVAEVERDFVEREKSVRLETDDERDEAHRDATNTFYAEDYHDAAVRAAAALGAAQKFEQLVIDEAQDVCSESALLSLDALLVGGLRDGRWTAFGDFSRQAVYSAEPPEVLFARIRECGRDVGRGRLVINCRNTRNIALETAAISGFEAPPSRFGVQDGPPVDRRYYSRDEEQRAALERTITELLAHGIKPQDIVVLSRFTARRSAVFAGEYGGFRLAVQRPEGSRIPTILFSTAHAFKGMESAVVIVADCCGEVDEPLKKLLYVAMSRARSRLVLLLSEQLRSYADLATKRQVEWQLRAH